MITPSFPEYFDPTNHPKETQRTLTAPSLLWLIAPIIGWIVFAVQWGQYKSLQNRVHIEKQEEENFQASYKHALFRGCPPPLETVTTPEGRLNVLRQEKVNPHHTFSPMKNSQRTPSAIRKDLEQDIHRTEVFLSNGERATSVDAIIEDVNSNWDLLDHLHQGLFAKAQIQIETFFGFHQKGLDALYRLANSGRLLKKVLGDDKSTRYIIGKEGENLTLKAYTYLELKRNTSNESMALIKVEIQVNLDKKAIMTKWKVVELDEESISSTSSRELSPQNSTHIPRASASTNELSIDDFVQVLDDNQELSVDDFVQVPDDTKDLSIDDFVQVLDDNQDNNQELSIDDFVQVPDDTQDLSIDDFVQVLDDNQDNNQELSIDDFEEVSHSSGFTNSENEELNHPIPKIAANEVLGTSTVIQYLNHLTAKQHGKMAVFHQFLHVGGSTSDITSWANRKLTENNDQLLFIPLILNKSWRYGEDHFVVLTIDAKANRLEYFDPRGSSSEDRTAKYLNSKVKDVIKAIKEEMPSLTSYLSNKTAHQALTDQINCGRFGIWFIRERVNSSMENIQKMPIQDVKTQLIEDLQT